MGKTIENYLSGMELGAAQSFGNMAVFPLLTSVDGGPEYITLKEALEKGVFAVTETSEGGSVPELKVENKGRVAVLLLDGEELYGAKQNRVLNTTILVAAGTATKIPVSCTEQGRWSYVSSEFGESGHLMERSLRSVNMMGVHASLVASHEFRSNQGAVWDGVANLARAANVSSRTGAMKDVYEAKRAALDDYLKSFHAVEGQKGMLAFLDGKAVGFDFVSRPVAFERLFPKLVKSYAMEAMLAAENKGKDKAGRGAKTAVEAPSADAARAFLAVAGACEEQRHESVGLGWYYRYSGKDVVGSALAVEDKVVHMAFFSVEEAEEAGPMAGMNRRRAFRII
jgi:hypothetical protein